MKSDGILQRKVIVDSLLGEMTQATLFDQCHLHPDFQEAFGRLASITNRAARVRNICQRECPECPQFERHVKGNPHLFFLDRNTELWRRRTSSDDISLDLPPDTNLFTPEADYTGKSIERLVKQRDPEEQRKFRCDVFELHGPCCQISGIKMEDFLQAIHIKPWATFPEDRRNPYNGLPMEATLHKAFDKGYFTIGPNGVVTPAAALPLQTFVYLKFNNLHITVFPQQEPFLRWHYENVFKGV